MARLLELKYAAAMGTAASWVATLPMQHDMAELGRAWEAVTVEAAVPASSYGEVSRGSRPLLVVAADVRTRRSYSAFGIGLAVHPPLLAGLGVTADLASGERGRGSGRGCRTSCANPSQRLAWGPATLREDKRGTSNHGTRSASAEGSDVRSAGVDLNTPASSFIRPQMASPADLCNGSHPLIAVSYLLGILQDSSAVFG
eukprot:scaffold1346_cov440-Prasinococcus_capsulatus_cf.AAC.1